MPGPLKDLYGRVCTACQTYKPWGEFGEMRHGTIRRNCECKSCNRKRAAAYKKEDKERAQRQRRTHRQKYLKKIKERDRQYRQKNAEYLRQKRKEYRQQNRDKVLAQQRAHYAQNKNRRIADTTKYTRARRQTDPQYKLRYTIAGRIAKAIKAGGSKKHSNTEELLGCSFKEAKTFLESKFQEGMTWENHGLHGWHIDHVCPLASFDLTDPQQQKQAFHYTNLQPLWAKDNLSKGKRHAP